MLIKIDWISFSIPMDVSKMEDDRDAPSQVISSVDHLHKDLSEWLSLEAGFEARKGRAPYSTSWHREDGGLVVFTNPRLPHALIEISGKGCDLLADGGNINNVLSASASRLTRIDIACDIATATRPLAFAERRDIKRFKAHSYVHSESGETYYVGAKTSDRYCRVYRWSEPHPRYALLRVEYVIKAENAKITARAILEEGLSSVAANLGLNFGWQHPDWRLDDEAAELAVYRPERRTGKTVYWLCDTIAPLIVRLQAEGVLDAEEWFSDYVISKIKN